MYAFVRVLTRLTTVSESAMSWLRLVESIVKLQNELTRDVLFNV
jgi:hypothetical protein